MFDFDIGKILVVAVVALVVVGPKDLPRVLVTIARIVTTARRVTSQFRARAKEMIDDVDLDGMKNEFAALDRSATAAFAFDPKTAMRGRLPETVPSPTVADEAATAPDAYSSPEMREYLSPLPPSGLEQEAVSSPERGVAMSESLERSP